MGLDVKVKIDITKPAGNLGTWFPVFYLVDSAAETDAYGEYKDLEEVVEAGFKEDSEVYKAVNLMLMQNAVPDKFAILKQKEFAVDTFGKYRVKGFRQVVLVGASDDSDVVSSLSEYIETTDLMLYITVTNKEKLSKTDGKPVYKLDRTFVMYHTNANAMSALVGATAGYKTGSFTYKNIILKGVDALELRDAELDEIHALGAITIVEKAGDIVTSEGKVSSGEYADIIDAKDFIIQNITYKTQKVFNANKKVAYTNAGISLIESATVSVLKTCFANGMIADDDKGAPLYSTNFIPRSQTSADDRVERKYPYGNFKFELAGAIHYAEITGEILI